MTSALGVTPGSSDVSEAVFFRHGARERESFGVEESRMNGDPIG